MREKGKNSIEDPTVAKNVSTGIEGRTCHVF